MLDKTGRALNPNREGNRALLIRTRKTSQTFLGSSAVLTQDNAGEKEGANRVAMIPKTRAIAPRTKSIT